jgi:hypothetical protein
VLDGPNLDSIAVEYEGVRVQMSRMTLRKAIESAITPGVTERRPIPGVVYHGFVVHRRAAVLGREAPTRIPTKKKKPRTEPGRKRIAVHRKLNAGPLTTPREHRGLRPLMRLRHGY